MIELLVNVLPNLLRYQIMEAIETPIKTRIQSELDLVDVEQLIKSKLPKIEQLSQQSQLNLDRFDL